MSRPLPGPRALFSESEDSGGLAEALEPVVELRGLADVLEPDLAEAGDRLPRVPERIPDFAFADTVFAPASIDPAPPVLLNDDLNDDLSTRSVIPIALPVPGAASGSAAPARLGALCASVRDACHRSLEACHRSLEEMRELWGNTADLVDGDVGPQSSAKQPGAFVVFAHRILALWSCFRWSRADLTRAALIGSAVFVLAGAVGATTMDSHRVAPKAGAASSEVRPARTLDRHPARKIVRMKRCGT